MIADFYMRLQETLKCKIIQNVHSMKKYIYIENAVLFVTHLFKVQINNIKVVK